jgi:hypothetical protein
MLEIEEVYLLTDSQSLVSNLATLNPRATERRLLIDLHILRQLLHEHGVQVAFNSNQNNSADPLTKRIPDNNGKALHDVITSNFIDLSAVDI